MAGHAEPGKALPVRSNILIKGPRVILTPGAPGINASRKLTEASERERLIAIVTDTLAAQAHSNAAVTDLGAIIRTSAEGAPTDGIVTEVTELYTTWCAIETAANNLESGWLAKAGILTSDIEVEWLGQAPDALIIDPRVTTSPPAEAVRGGTTHLWGDRAMTNHIERTEDPLESLGVCTCLNGLASPGIEFSNGSMTIEPTRALIAIDVNTGADFSPAAGLKANLSAARELPRQLRLRGLGGQIVIDFAPMPKKDRRTLEEALRKSFRADPVETSLVGWTTLGHYELQRKRERRPLHEVL
ncbi:MAG: ribonuclease E/G [Pseudomonadota bacterium]